MTMPSDPKIIEAVILACLERNPVDFCRVDDNEVRRVQRGIKRATTAKGAAFRCPVTRNHFLCGCLDFTENLLEEHLIVGYGYRHANTTKIDRVHHVGGDQRHVAIPDYIRTEIRKHHFHRSDAEVIVFHNHPRTGDEAEWLYTLKSLIQDLPIASNADRKQLQHYAFNPVGLLGSFWDKGKCSSILGRADS